MSEPDFERARYGDGFMYAIFLPGSSDEEGACPEILADPRHWKEIRAEAAVSGWLDFEGVTVEGTDKRGRRFPIKVMGGSVQVCEGILVRYHDGVEGPDFEDPNGGQEPSRDRPEPTAPPSPFRLSN